MGKLEDTETSEDESVNTSSDESEDAPTQVSQADGDEQTFPVLSDDSDQESHGSNASGSPSHPGSPQQSVVSSVLSRVPTEVSHVRRSSSRSQSPKSGGSRSSSNKSGHSKGSRSSSNSPVRSRSESKSPRGSRSPRMKKIPTPSRHSRSHSPAGSKSPRGSSSSGSSRSSKSSRVSRSRSRSRSASKSPTSTTVGRERRSRLDSKNDRKRKPKVESKSPGSDRSAASSVASRKSSEGGAHSSHSGSAASSEDEIGKKKKSGRIGEEKGGSEDKEEPTSTNLIPEKPMTKTAQTNALFGDADDISSGDDSEKAKSDDEKSVKSGHKSDADSEKEVKSDAEKSDKVGRSDDEDGRDVDEEKGDDEDVVHDEPVELPETRIDVEIPKISTDLGKGLHFVKLPNFLSVERRPFDANTYEDEIDDEETLDEEGKARLKLKVENTIRWRERFNEKNVFVKESNCRFVRWSDGSLSLHLGDEIFNVYKQPLQGDHNHLFIRQGTGLQGQAVFRTKLTFRPHSTESFTHRKMTMSLADRSSKTAGIKVLSTVGTDPEQNRDELIKKEEHKLRASVQRESKQRRARERVSNRGLSGQYLEDDFSDDENAISLSAIKNRYKKNARGGRAGPSGGQGRKSQQPIYSSDESNNVDGDDDEEGSDLELQKGKTKTRRRLHVTDDEDDEAEEGEPEAEDSTEKSAPEDEDEPMDAE